MFELRAYIPVTVEGLDGEWRVDPDALDQPFTGRTALLSPFDRLVHDRQRTIELFDFDYILEMFKAAAKRRWGYFALPVLHGDRLIGKLDAKADRKAGTFTVNAARRGAVHQHRYVPTWKPKSGRWRRGWNSASPRRDAPEFGPLVTAPEAFLGLQAFG